MFEAIAERIRRTPANLLRQVEQPNKSVFHQSREENRPFEAAHPLDRQPADEPLTYTAYRMKQMHLLDKFQEEHSLLDSMANSKKDAWLQIYNTYLDRKSNPRAEALDEFDKVQSKEDFFELFRDWQAKTSHLTQFASQSAAKELPKEAITDRSPVIAHTAEGRWEEALRKARLHVIAAKQKEVHAAIADTEQQYQLDYSDTAVPAEIRKRHERALSELDDLIKDYEGKHGQPVAAPAGTLAQAIEDVENLHSEIYLKFDEEVD